MERMVELKCTPTGWQVICKANGTVVADFLQPFVVIFGKDWSLLIAKAIANRWIDLAELQLSPSPVFGKDDFDAFVNEEVAALRAEASLRSTGKERMQ